MDTERWQQIDSLFAEALELPEAERGSFLAEACGGDLMLRGEIEELLGADGQLDHFREEPFDRTQITEIVGVVPEPEAGSLLGPYRLLRVLGSGGSGVVYLAARGRERFALKLCRNSYGATELWRRFRREHRFLVRLAHPNVERLYDAGTLQDGCPYLVMELVDGIAIDRYCDEHRLSVEQRLGLFLQLCSAVAHAHENDLVHRDIKPANVLVTHDGEVKLLDFGIAKLLATDRSSQASLSTGLHMMTLGYASPEQMRGEKVTLASDIFSLGILLFELLTGLSPYELEGPLPLAIEHAVCTMGAQRMSVILDRRIGSSFRPSRWSAGDALEASRLRGFDHPRGLRRHLAGPLDDIVAMALSLDPQKRYHSAGELCLDLKRHLRGDPVVARLDFWARWRRRRRQVETYWTSTLKSR